MTGDPVKGKCVVQVDGLTFTYSGHDKPAISDISFAVGEGEFVCVAGPSGCGKSTLALAIAGFIPHAYPGMMQGKVYIEGSDTTALSPGALSGAVGLVQQDPEGQLCTLKVVDEIAFGPENMRLSSGEIGKRVDWALKAVGASNLAHRSVYTLSGGEKQRVAIASVLAMQPSVFILDEPTASLDPEGTAQVLSVIHGLRGTRRMAVIVIEHRLRRILPLAGRLVVMEGGRVTDNGPPADVLSRNRSLAAPSRRAPLHFRRPPLRHLSFPDSHSTCPGGVQPVEAESEKPPCERVQSEAVPAAHNAPLLTTERLSVAYEDKSVLDDVNLVFRPGEIVAIMGDNGSGKTSLLSAIMGLVKPSAGTVRLEGRDIAEDRVAARAKSMGLSFQNPNHQLSESTVIDEVAAPLRNLKSGASGEPAPIVPGVSSQDRARVAVSDGAGTPYFTHLLSVLDRFGLQGYMDDNPFSLSLGEKKRVTLASSLAYEPKVLLLDEPLVGQDPSRQVSLMEYLTEFAGRGGLVLMVCHEPQVVRDWCDRLLFFSQGRLVVDSGLPEAFDALASCGKSHYLPDDGDLL